MAKIRVLIVDDHAIVRAGLRMLINPQPDMEVVGEVADGHEALRQAREANPDVLTLDLTMPGGGGLKTLEGLRQACPQTRVLVLTMHEDPSYLRGAGRGRIGVRRQVGGRWRVARRDPLRRPGSHLCDDKPQRQRDSASPRRPGNPHRIGPPSASPTEST